MSDTGLRWLGPYRRASLGVSQRHVQCQVVSPPAESFSNLETVVGASLRRVFIAMSRVGHTVTVTLQNPDPLPLRLLCLLVSSGLRGGLRSGGHQ